MLAFIGLTTIVLISTLGLARWSFDQGFRDYVNAIEMIRLGRISNHLSRVYLENNRDWSSIEPSMFKKHLESRRYQDPLQRQLMLQCEKKKDNPDFVYLGPPLKQLFESGKNARENQSNRHPTAIFDLQGQKIFGDELDSSDSQLAVTAVTVGGTTIAYLKSSPVRLLNTSIETDYSRQQWTTSGFIAAQSLLLALIASFILVKILMKPIRKLIFGVNEISKGNYSQPFSEERYDEFGQLMSNINHLTYTLKKTQDTRQRWLADISHELRTPLTVLTADIELLKEGIRPLNQDSLSLIDKEVSALRVMTDDLYQLSVSDIGGLRYEYSDLDLKEQVLEVIETYKFSAEAKGLELVFSEADRCIICADRKRIKQLLSNLLSNAIAYTDAPGKIVFKLRAHVGKVVLILTDTAPGPRPEDCAQLFEPLYRKDESLSRRTSGAGLGLAICRNIVEAHRGTIVAAPSGLGGLEVSIELPISHEKTTR